MSAGHVDAQTPKCPGCGKAPAEKFEPFCSQGCRDRDLLKWLDEGYRIPGPPADPEGE
ncbi:DNA gyrase inhibitor YacG [Rhizorhabdus histidinilytica]